MKGQDKIKEQLINNIYAESPIGIELYDSDGQLLDANQACLDMFGVSDVAEVKGFKLFEDPNVSDEAKARLRKGEAVRYKVPFDFEKVRELGLYETTKSGIVYLDVLITPLRLKKRTCRRLFGASSRHHRAGAGGGSAAKSSRRVRGTS